MNRLLPYLCKVINFRHRLSTHFMSVLLGILATQANPAYAQTSSATNTQNTNLIADALAPFDGDFAEVILDGKKQYLHRSGRIWVDKLEQYGAPVCIVVKNGAYGAINQQGDVIADFKYDRIYYEYDDNYFFAVLQLDGKFGAVDTLGKVIAQPIYEAIRPLNERVIAAQRSGKWGLLSLEDGREVLPFDYDELRKSYGPQGWITTALNQKEGIRSADGQHELAPIQYDEIHLLSLANRTMIAAKQDLNAVLLDSAGQVLTTVPCDFLRAEGERIQFGKDGKRGWLTSRGEVIIPPTYDGSSEWQGGFCVVEQDGRKGVIAADGKTVLPCQYPEIRIMDLSGGVYGEPTAILVEENGKQGLLGLDGQPILPSAYDEIRLDQAGTIPFIWATNDGKYGIFDLSGKEVVPMIHAQPAYGYGPSIQSLPSSMPIVALPEGELGGLYDLEKEQWIVQPEYQQIEWQLGSFFKATQYKTGDDQIPISAYFTREGTQLIPPTEYLFVDAVDTDRYVVKEPHGGYWETELFDRSGKRLYRNKDWDFDVFRFNKLLVPDTVSIREGIGHFQSGLLKVAAEDNLFVDRSGREHRFEAFDYVGDFYNGRAIATQKVEGVEHIGIIDTAGNTILPPIYTDMDKLYDTELIRVSTNQKTGLIAINGTVQIDAIYDHLEKVNHKTSQLYYARNGDKMGVVDDHGQVVIPLAYDRIQFHDTFFVVTAQEKQGFVSIDGKVWVAPKYDEVRLNDSYYGYFPALVQEGDRWTYIDPINSTSSFQITGKTKLGY